MYAFISNGIVQSIADLDEELEGWVKIPAKTKAEVFMAYVDGKFVEAPADE